MSRLTALAYAIVYCLALPLIVLKLLRAPGMLFLKQRLGIELPKLQTGSIWLHASSVGEVALLEPVVRALEQEYPERPLLITAFTATGIESARRRFAGHSVCAMPFDLAFAVRSYVHRVEPALVIIFESEFWPALLSYLKRAHIPVAVFNGKISDRSVKAHLRTRFVVQALTAVTKMAVQDESNAERFRALEVPPARIHVTGNMKFDLVVPSDTDATRSAIGIDDHATVIIGGSLHEGEARALLDAIYEPDKVVPSVVVLLAPRYVEAASELVEEAERRGLFAVLKSSANQPVSNRTGFDVCVVDTFGELRSLYAIADIVFVGGSLFDRGSNRGGHNLMEPAICGVPVLFGPFNYSFAQVAGALEARGGGRLVSTTDELRQALAEIGGNHDIAARMGTVAREVVLAGRGATARNLALIHGLLEQRRH